MRPMAILGARVELRAAGQLTSLNDGYLLANMVHGQWVQDDQSGFVPLFVVCPRERLRAGKQRGCGRRFLAPL